MIHNSVLCDTAATRRLAAAAAGESARSFVAAEAAVEAEVALQAAVADEAAVSDGQDGEAECAPCEEAASVTEVAAPARTGSDQRRAQLRAMVSDRRLAMVRCCLDGRCSETEEAVMRCRGRDCRITLHGVACAQLSSGFASLGRFLCAECHLRKLAPSTPPDEMGEAAWRRALATLVLELCVGAEQTGAGLGAFKALELKFVASLKLPLADCVLPSDDAAVCKMFLEWLVEESPKSLDTVWRAMGSAIGRTRIDNVTKDVSVRALYESLCQRHGEEAAPRTALTRRMLWFLAHELIAKHSGERTFERVQLMYLMEVMLGLRVGEALSGGDYHGLLANNFVILTHQGTGRVSTEAMLEHSKTKFQRWINAVGTSEGAAQLELAAALRAYWVRAGFAMRGETRDGVWQQGVVQGGYLVEGPNYSVLRLSLLGVSESDFGRACRMLAGAASQEVRHWVPYVRLRGGERRTAKSSMDKRYINVAGGPAGCAAIGEAMLALQAAGLGDLAEEVPGPLMRATHGDVLGYAHMPLQPSSTYASLHAMLDEAYVLANPVGDPDPELDLKGQAAPLWGHHSLRRAADTIARASMDESGATEQDIDLYFGWLEKQYSQKMQLHYASRHDREQRTCVTRFV